MCGFSESEVADIRLAAGEAFSNAVEHGRSARSSGFAVTCQFADGMLTIDVRDSGSGFQPPEDAPCAAPGERARGYGILLMRRLMDSVVFSSGGKLVRMTRRLRRPTPI
jgi:anti-sigma regulatory factor (Ser/Thr protein kinase)